MKTKGYITLVCAAVLFGLCPQFASQLIGGGVSPSSLVAIEYAFMCLVNVALCGLGGKKRLLKVTKRQALILIATGAVGVGLTTFLNSSAFIYIPTGTAIAIHFFYPTLVAAAMALWFKERYTWLKGLASVISIAGMAVLMGFTVSGSAAGFVLAGLSAVTYSVYFIASQVSAYAPLDARVKMVYLGGAASAAFFALALLGGGVTPPVGMRQWLLMLGLAACCGGAHMLLVYGVRVVGAVNGAFTTLIEPITVALAGIFILGERASPPMLLGLALVLSAVFLMGVRGKRQPLG